MPATKVQRRVTFKNVLFATDLSPAANAALPFAARIARNFGANLYAIHVQEPANYALPPEAWRSVELAVETGIEELRSTLRLQCPELTPHILQREGAVWPAIESAIGKNQIDLIVLGTRGRTGIGKALLGSRAEAILRNAPCPVLTVGPHAFRPKPECAKLSSILLATDFGPASLVAAPIAISLAEECEAKLTLLHVIDHGEARADQPSSNLPPDERERQLRALVADRPELWCTPHFVVASGDAGESILDVAQRTQADLIVLGAHAPAGVPGASTHLPIATVHKVVSLAECAVLTVRG